MPHHAELLDDLERIERAADGWLETRTERFCPLTWSTVDERRLRRKAFAEAAQYLSVAAEQGADPPPALRRLVLDRTNDGRYAALLSRHPGQFLKYAYPPVYADHVGALSATTRRAFEETLETRTVRGTERVPHRLLDLWHVCRMYGHETDLDAEAILEHGSLRSPPAIPDADLSDAYAVTHSLLFYHNFGVERDAFPPGPAPYDLRTALVGLTLRYVAAGNYDVVLELVLGGVLQGALPLGFVRFVVSWVDDAVRASGRVPAPEGDEVHTTGADGVDTTRIQEWDDAGREWARRYHPTLVAGMVARVLPSRLDDLGEIDLDHGRHADALRCLGEALRALAAYDLAGGAETLRSLRGSPVVDAYPSVVDRATAYLRAQRTDDGDVGYWTDERHLYVERGPGDAAEFHERFVVPTAAACTAALRALSDDDGGFHRR